VGEPSSLWQRASLQELADCRRELRRLRLDRTAAQVRLTRQRANKGAGEEGKGAASKLEEEIAVLTEQEKLLSAEVEKFGTSIEGIGIRSIDLEVLQNEIARAEETLRQLAAQRDRLIVELKTKPQRISLLTEASAAPR